jgi:hypothetical protein
MSIGPEEDEERFEGGFEVWFMEDPPFCNNWLMRWATAIAARALSVASDILSEQNKIGLNE